jgi:hypothetical protein
MRKKECCMSTACDGRADMQPSFDFVWAYEGQMHDE